MSFFYPQAAMTLRVLWEDFGDAQVQKLQELYLMPILARSIVVKINDYRTADTFEAEIDYKNFPFDPRCIRACGVTIHAQNMKAVFSADNSLNLLKPTRENSIFLGFADEESISFDDSKRTVRMEGRDFTSLFIDRKYIGPSPNLEQRLDVALSSILAELKESQEIKLDNRVPEELPILASFSPSKDPLANRKNVRRNETYWDVIQDLVARAGLIAYIELDKLVLTKPRVLYDKASAKVFVYGHNIKKLEYKRKLGRRKGFNIVVRSLNPESKEVLEAKIPMEATDEWSKATGIGNTEVKVPERNPEGLPLEEKDLKPAQYISFLVPNIANKPRLIEIAQELYEEIGRQQIDGSFTTKEMEICYKKLDGDGNPTNNHEEFDVLKLRNGTPIAIVIKQDDLAQIEKISDKAQRKKFLIARCYPENIAEAFAETMGKSSNIFYTRAVTFRVDADGFTSDIDFINFIETSSKFGGNA